MSVPNVHYFIVEYINNYIYNMYKVNLEWMFIIKCLPLKAADICYIYYYFECMCPNTDWVQHSTQPSCIPFLMYSKHPMFWGCPNTEESDRVQQSTQPLSVSCLLYSVFLDL